MAGVSTKDIKNRIRSMESTKQITKAMEMVAASKLRQAQNQLIASRPYFEILYKTITEIAATQRDFSSPFFRKREGNKALYVVIAGDRGLAGGYNSNALKLCIQQAQDKEAVFLPIGKKAVDYFRSHDLEILTDMYYEVAAVSISDCFAIAKRLSDAFRSDEYDEIHIVYTSFVNILTQTAVTLRMLPFNLDNITMYKGSRIDTVFEPSTEEVFDAIVPDYLGGIIYGAICDSRCSEQAARRSAMDSATQNAKEMIEDLSVKYNRARQAAITQEITEIVAGAEA